MIKFKRDGLKKCLLSKPAVCVLSVCAGFLLGQLIPSFSTTTVKEKTKESKLVKRKIDNSIRTTTITKPDGTTIRTEVKSDVKELTELDKRLVEKTKIIKRDQISYGVSVIAVSSIQNPFALEYGLRLEKRLVGPVWVDAFMTNGLQMGVGVGFKF